MIASTLQKYKIKEDGNVIVYRVGKNYIIDATKSKNRTYRITENEKEKSSK